MTQTIEREKQQLHATLKLLETKELLLARITRGELGDPEPVQTFQPNGLGYATTDTPVSRTYVWKFGSSYAIDTYGKLYQSSPHRIHWKAYHPAGIEQLTRMTVYIQDFLI